MSACRDVVGAGATVRHHHQRFIRPEESTGTTPRPIVSVDQQFNVCITILLPLFSFSSLRGRRDILPFGGGGTPIADRLASRSRLRDFGRAIPLRGTRLRLQPSPL